MTSPNEQKVTKVIETTKILLTEAQNEFILNYRARKIHHFSIRVSRTYREHIFSYKNFKLKVNFNLSKTEIRLIKRLVFIIAEALPDKNKKHAVLVTLAPLKWKEKNKTFGEFEELDDSKGSIELNERIDDLQLEIETLAHELIHFLQFVVSVKLRYNYDLLYLYESKKYGYKNNKFELQAWLEESILWQVINSKK